LNPLLLLLLLLQAQTLPRLMPGWLWRLLLLLPRLVCGLLLLPATLLVLRHR
jgi:hypothetical protein